MKIKEWFENIKKKMAATTTLVKFDIQFKTVDGETHIYSGVSACDPETILVSPLDYYLIGEEYLHDDDGVFYPMKSIVSIKMVNCKRIENVKKRNIGSGFSQIWYPRDEIEIIEK